MRYKVKVTVEFNLACNPLDAYASVWSKKILHGEYIFGDVSADDPQWLMGWCTKLPPYFEDGMLVMPPDVNGDSSYTELRNIGGPIQVHYENLGEYQGLEPGTGMCKVPEGG